MEMPTYRRPMLRITVSRTWFRLRDFVLMAFPVMIMGNLVIQIANLLGLLNFVQGALSPITVLWLGLPVATGVTLVFGILRKELTLILLASLMGTSNFALILTPTQMFVFAFVVMIYVPCIATIAVLAKEFGYMKAAIISLTEVSFAIALGGVLYRALVLIGF
jgi:ferrous iron transport protein B